MKIIKKNLLLYTLLLFILSFSQNIKVTYTYRPSDISEFEENVFLNGNYKVSIKDSIPTKTFQPNNTDDVIIQDKKNKFFRRVLIDDLKKNNIYFTQGFGKTNYLVNDNPPEIKWDLKHKETKKINNYTCKKATAKWRGSNLEAYYTTEIPTSIGPYKFKGLPGLIMEIRTLGVNNQYWVIKKIQYPYNGVPNYSTKYIKSLEAINIRDFVKKIDKRTEEEQSIFISKLQLPKGVKLSNVETTMNTRGMVEEKYEWE